MKIAICGSRKYHNYEELKRIVDQYAPSANQIISGGAKGADNLAERYAKERELSLKVIWPDYENFPAKYAPLERNTRIISEAETVFAFYADKKQGGTLDAAKKALTQNKRLIEILNGKVSIQESQLSLF